MGRVAGEAQHAVNTAIRDAARAAQGAVRGSARALRRVGCRLRISLREVWAFEVNVHSPPPVISLRIDASMCNHLRLTC